MCAKLGLQQVQDMSRSPMQVFLRTALRAPIFCKRVELTSMMIACVRGEDDHMFALSLILHRLPLEFKLILGNENRPKKELNDFCKVLSIVFLKRMN